ncbi:mandelate racemase/muconate lactonizing enzyme family protein [Benzoatithermus flavus]|uniref:Mandelate racemase/muconate lactonizing enzyme family protein n=1 Tax=Benzoatithermus flavus TaxID=3108223 RepID=A0ABU8XVJ7_9PROT
MPAIERVEILMVDLAPKVVRTDAIQAFVSQETPIVRLYDRDGAVGTGYSYTIGTGGSSVVRLIRDHLAPMLIGRDADMIEDIWRALLFRMHATWPGAVTSLALAAIDTALWDLRCRRAELPLYVLAGGAQERVPAYTTEGGWLQLSVDELVEEALEAKERGFKGAKLKIGKPGVAEDVARVAAVREAVGSAFELMVDANQGLTPDQALRRARALEELDLAWLEEPLPADDVAGHARLAAATRIPLAVGESLYSPGQFKEYLVREACGVVQVDVARIGGITPWLKVAHLAETFGLPVAPHFLMELHVSLAAAVPNGRWVEHIPQLDEIALDGVSIHDGMAIPPEEPGLGIDWNWDAIEQRRVGAATLVVD